jgi:hypothetical protein
LRRGIAAVLLVGLVAVVVGCGGNTTVTVVKTVTAATQPSALPTPSPTPTPHVPGVGDAIRITGSGQQIDVKLVAFGKSRWMPYLTDPGSHAPGVSPRDDETWVIVQLRFENTGSTYYHSRVANWCWLTVAKNPGSKVQASGAEYDLEYQDWQGGGDTPADHGQLQLDPGGKAKWFVAFRVLAAAKPLTLTYQGPGNKKVTWVMRKT